MRWYHTIALLVALFVALTAGQLTGRLIVNYASKALDENCCACECLDTVVQDE